MMKHALSVVAFSCVILLAPTGVAAEEDLFEEAGHSLSRSKWISIRTLPSIEIALESDDVVLVESIDHAPKSLAMKLDDKAVAADCDVNESKDQSYAYTTETQKKDDDDKDKKVTTGRTTNISHTTYISSCRFDKGTTALATEARAITVQIAFPQGTTKPKRLSPKALGKFQWLNK